MWTDLWLSCSHNPFVSTLPTLGLDTLKVQELTNHGIWLQSAKQWNMYHRPKQLLVNRANIPVKQDRRLLQIHLLTQANLRIPCKSLPFEAHRMWRVEPKGIVGQSSKRNNLIGK